MCFTSSVSSTCGEFLDHQGSEAESSSVAGFKVVPENLCLNGMRSVHWPNPFGDDRLMFLLYPVAAAFHNLRLRESCYTLHKNGPIEAVSHRALHLRKCAAPLGAMGHRGLDIRSLVCSPMRSPTAPREGSSKLECSATRVGSPKLECRKYLQRLQPFFLKH